MKNSRYSLYISRFRNQYTRKRNHHSRLSTSYGARNWQIKWAQEYLREFLDSLRSSIERTAAVCHASDLVGEEICKRTLYTCACRFITRYCYYFFNFWRACTTSTSSSCHLSNAISRSVCSCRIWSLFVLFCLCCFCHYWHVGFHVEKV